MLDFEWTRIYELSSQGEISPLSPPQMSAETPGLSTTLCPLESR
jgi:hypothetical protein